MNLHTDLTSFIKVNSRIIELNLKFKTIKLLEDKIRKNLDDVGFGNNFLDATPKP